MSNILSQKLGVLVNVADDFVLIPSPYILESSSKSIFIPFLIYPFDTNYRTPTLMGNKIALINFFLFIICPARPTHQLKPTRRPLGTSDRHRLGRPMQMME